MAHRLLLLPGKCQQIHGHTMTIEMQLFGELDGSGILGGLDFGNVKEQFRGHLNDTFDHRLHLNSQDPWAKVLQDVDQHNAADHLPGLQTWPGDPTTENFAKWICEWAEMAFIYDSDVLDAVRVSIQETETNGAEYILP
jgi:6-pyruvoyltetrahydropterin/6-carboxytetrahydropterin synthase